MSESVTLPIHKQNIFQAVGPFSDAQKATLSEVFQTRNFDIHFVDISDLTEAPVISFDQAATRRLQKEGKTFYNWDLLFSVLGPNDKLDDLEKKITARVEVLSAIKSLKSRPHSEEFHGSIRVRDLAASARFYSWLFSTDPKEWRPEKEIQAAANFLNTIEGRTALDIIRSLIQTCSAAEVNAAEYLNWVLRCEEKAISDDPVNFTPYFYGQQDSE